MSLRLPQTPSAEEERVTSLMATVERLVAERRDAEALPLFNQAAAMMPDHPRVLQEHARLLVLGGDPAEARAVLERAVSGRPRNVNLLLSLAAVLRELGEREQELAVLERALAAEPRHLIVLLQKAAVLELMGKPRTAAVIYTRALETLPPGIRLPPPVAAHVAHARQQVARNSDQLAAALEERLRPLRPGTGSPAPLLRVERALDRMLGRKPIYSPQPTLMYFPFLGNYEFHPREEFPWLEGLEAASQAIRDEALAVLACESQSLTPYIAYPESVPLDQWRELNHSRRWSAYFLWKDGERNEEHCRRCAATAAALEQTPRVDIPGRGPTAFFSILDARTHIPPHTGSTNVRLTVHVPLVLPGACRFRVGGEVREWRFGEAWVFDDSIEHEAWNDADAPRAILIFDVWNPQLTSLERDLVREAMQVFAQYNREEGGAAGVDL